MADRGYALVTGASKGLGAEMAVQLAEDKWNLILAARSKPELEALARDLEARCGVRCVALQADLAAPSAARDLWAQVESLGLPVEVLINNAGFGLLGPFRETPLERELEMIQVNVTALTAFTKLVLPSMVERKRGFILNVASTAGFVAGPYMAVYYASKAYVISFSEALHTELGGTGISVTALCPGATRTEFAATAKSSDSKLFKGSNVMEAAPVVRAGLAGMFAGRALVIPGFQNKLMIQSLRFSPRALVRKITARLQTRG